MTKHEYLSKHSLLDEKTDTEIIALQKEYNEKRKEVLNSYRQELSALKKEYKETKVKEKDLSREQLKELRDDYKLPFYFRGEEITNSVTHIVGGAFGIVALVLGIIFSVFNSRGLTTLLSVITFAITTILLYSVSSIYHGLHINKGKEVFQVIDHCTIYLLIAGTYTPIVLIGLESINPFQYVFLGCIYLLSALGVVLNATMMRKKAVKVVSMILYVAIGWSIIFFYSIINVSLGHLSTVMLILGGVSYTIGSILYGIGKKVRYMHAIFHVFVLAGTILQFLSILFGALI